jgi:hypothetical protein
LSELAKRLESANNEVYVLDFGTLLLKHQAIDDDTYSIKLQKYNKIKFLDRIIRPLIINKILKEHHFDIVNFQFLYWHYIFSIFTFKKIKTKIFFTIFGSDFYRASVFKKRFIYIHILKEITGVIFTNNQTRKDFMAYYLQFSLLKTYVCRLGLPALKDIDKNRKKRDTFYEYFSLPIDKIVVTVGYNLTEQQQHIKVIDEINRLSLEKKKNLYVLFPLTYGGSVEYLKEIEKYLEKNATFSYKIFIKYMNNNEISKLRLVTDIMINVLETDQFSASMQEHLYANNIVIAGAWLPYGTFVQKGIVMQRIESIQSLSKVLLEVLEHMQEIKEKSKDNAKYIAELSSWDNVISCWKTIFE